MAPRTVPPKPNREPIFGPPATTPEQAFLRFGNAMHWELYFLDGRKFDALVSDEDAFCDLLIDRSLKRLPKAEHRLVVEFILDLTAGSFTFAEAQTIWRRSENYTHAIGWNEPGRFLDILLKIRDRIDPFVWPASRPCFRAG